MCPSTASLALSAQFATDHTADCCWRGINFAFTRRLAFQMSGTPLTCGYVLGRHEQIYDRHISCDDVHISYSAQPNSRNGDPGGVTWCVIEEVKSGDWSIGGQSLTTEDVHAMAQGDASQPA
jgi:hypothetical protein